MLESFAFSALGGLIGSLTMFFLAKRAFSKDRILDISQEIVDESLDRLVNVPEMQKRLYMAGVIVGNGVKQGIGITAKGGKFKFENLIGEGLSILMQSVLPGVVQKATGANQPGLVSDPINTSFK